MTPKDDAVDPYKFTIGFIRCAETNEVLMLNRQKAPWMGRWNGVGGKIEVNETPYECMVREAKEETGLNLPQFISRGILEWVKDDHLGGGYLFTADISKEERDHYKTPLAYSYEGILDWKVYDWLIHDQNTGVVPNVRYLMKDLFSVGSGVLFRSVYNEQGEVLSFDKCEH